MAALLSGLSTKHRHHQRGILMAFQSIAGGFKITGDDATLLNEQRAITKAVNDKFVQVGAVYLKTSSKNPIDEDWAKKAHHDCDLQSWIDSEDHQLYNVGFNLQLGWMDIDIDAEDPEYNKCILSALEFLQIDSRFKFGRHSVGCATHVLLQLGEDESQNFEYLVKFEPKEFRLNDKRYHVQLRSFPTNTSEKNIARSAKQTVMPGSVYTHKTKPSAYDISVWYASGTVARNVKHVAATTPRKVGFNEVVRAITFGTFLYIVRDEWIEGSRQETARKVGGWLARVVRDSQAMNNHEAIASDVFCPVDSDDIAERLIHFVCREQGDDEAHMRVRAYHDARDKLERNPDAKIPGWPAMDLLFGGEKVVALRTVFMPGSDVSQLTKMAERYIYDETDNRYIDRSRFFTQASFVHPGDELERRHKGDVVRIGGKPKEAFRLFESSDLRKRVGQREIYPELTPGGIFRISGMGEVLADDEDDDKTALAVFNTWRGWPISPATKVDEALLNDCIMRLDMVLKYLTRDNDTQIDWIKRWMAWIFQHPGEKQSIAWVCVGGMGVGKSWVGNIFMKALMGNLWGSASPKVLEGDFTIGPFKDKMFVFIDEAKFHSEAGTDEFKKLIRGVDVPGSEKFVDARNYRLFARVMLASNKYAMNIGQSDTRDRALFYTRAYDKDHLNMTEMEFRVWADTLKPFFDDFTSLLQRKDAKEHFMYYFMNLPCKRHEIESIKHSSSGDEHIVASNMSWARRIAKYIIEDGRIYEDLDISYPFTKPDFNKRVTEIATEMGMRGMMAERVLTEFQEAGVLGHIIVAGQKKLRFTHRIGSLTEMYGAAIGLTLEERFVFDKDKDYGENTCDGSTRPPWKGNKLGVVAASKI